MDPAWLEDLKGQLMGLLIALEERLEESGARQVLEFIDVGEYGLALEEMADALAHGQAPIADHERSDMLALNDRMQMGDQVLRTAVLPSIRPLAQDLVEARSLPKVCGADWDKEMMR